MNFPSWPMAHPTSHSPCPSTRLLTRACSQRRHLLGNAGRATATSSSSPPRLPRAMALRVSGTPPNHHGNFVRYRPVQGSHAAVSFGNTDEAPRKKWRRLKKLLLWCLSLSAVVAFSLVIAMRVGQPVRSPDLADCVAIGVSYQEMAVL